MALVNFTLSSLSGGVSQQYEQGKYDSQVDEMVNCIPSLSRGVLRRNPLKAQAVLTNYGSLTDAYTYSYDRGTGDEQYIIIIPGDGSMSVYNINDTSGIPLYTKTNDEYLKVYAPFKAKDCFKALTIGDHTFITNTTVITDMDVNKLAPSAGWENMAFYWIKKTIGVTVNQYQDTDGESGVKQLGYDYVCNNIKIQGMTDTRPNANPAIDLNTSSLIANEFKQHAGDSYMVKSDGAIAYNAGYTLGTLKWEDSFGNQASLGVWKTVKDASKLPAQLPADLDGFLVQVTASTDAKLDDYYLKYDHTDTTWKEVPKPNVEIALFDASMPHVLYRLATASGTSTVFTFDTYKEVSSDGTALTNVSGWKERVSGGDTEEDDPSFIGFTIDNIFFHKNRLGFLTTDSIILSQSGIYGNFFQQTVQIVQDDDPIDLGIASTDVTILRTAVPIAGQLLIFSDDTQFKLASNNGPLTPDSAEITTLSNYTYGDKADATSVGNRVYFSNQAGGYSQVHKYSITDTNSDIGNADSITLHLPSYLDKSVNKIVGHDVLGFVFFTEEDKKKEIIILSTVTKSKQDIQNAFHRWTFKENIVGMHIIKNNLMLLFDTGSLCYIKLEIPGDIDSITYLDAYDNTPLPYESKLTFSQFFLRGTEGKGTLRGRFQLRTMLYTVEDVSRYLTVIENPSIIKQLGVMYEWDDTTLWDDDLIWGDTIPHYTREYKDDSKITIMSDSKNVKIAFTNNPDVPEKGFGLATVNIEGFFHQRSTRR